MPIPPAPSRLPQFLAALPWPLAAPGPRATTMGGTLWLDGYDHYDAPRCLLNACDLARAYGVSLPAGSPTWCEAAVASLRRYAAQVVPSGVTAWHAYASGAARLYLETGDEQALAVVRRLNPALRADVLENEYAGQDVNSRPVAFMIENCLAAQKCGLTSGLGEDVRLDLLARLALGHLDQWSRPPETRLWQTYCKPFMAGLSMLALIKYHERYDWGKIVPPELPAARTADLAAIPPAIERMCEWLWANAWLASHPSWPHGSFTYMDLDGKTARPPIRDCPVAGVTDRRTFRGPDWLVDRDDYYAYTGIAFETGPAARPLKNAAGAVTGFDKFRCVGYKGATREFTLSATYAPPSVPLAGDAFTIHSLVEPDGGPGPTADLNHLIAPAFAWLYARTGLAAWRERYDAIFDGGTMAHGPPTAHKQWNQALYAGGDGLRWRAEGAEKEEAMSVPPEPEPPRPRKFDVSMFEGVTMLVTVVPDGVAKSMLMRVAVDGAGKVQAYKVNTPAPASPPPGEGPA